MRRLQRRRGEADEAAEVGWAESCREITPQALQLVPAKEPRGAVGSQTITIPP
jgi:hypothetical protein